MNVCFFFQAEDGIRDRNVTGVQTCALPISSHQSPWLDDRAAFELLAVEMGSNPGGQQICRQQKCERVDRRLRRSEERRVGKECRSRRAAYHKKKKSKENTIQS